MPKKKNKNGSSAVLGYCLLCGKPPTKRERVDSEKDFVCSSCTQYLVEHPRKYGETIEDIIAGKKEVQSQ